MATFAGDRSDCRPSLTWATSGITLLRSFGTASTTITAATRTERDDQHEAWRSPPSSSPSALVSPKSSVPRPNPQMISSRPICTMKLAAESIALTPTAMPDGAADPLEEPHHHRQPADGARHGQADVGDDVLQLQRRARRGRGTGDAPMVEMTPETRGDLRHHEADHDAGEGEGLRPRRRTVAKSSPARPLISAEPASTSSAVCTMATRR